MNSTQHRRSLAISFCFAILLLFACDDTNKEQEKISTSNTSNEHAQKDTFIHLMV
jgi:outer membrane biogenesis lipoprotein LolB